MLTNERGQIIADLGIHWLRYVEGPYQWFSQSDCYRIERLPGKGFRLYLVHYDLVKATIFYGSTVKDCMRVAEMHKIRTFDLHYPLDYILGE